MFTGNYSFWYQSSQLATRQRSDKNKKAEWNTFQKSLKSKSTLIVSNWEGALASGSHINFKNVNGSVRYEMDETAINEHQIQAGLKIIQWKVNQ
jgi:hypothetical protein